MGTTAIATPPLLRRDSVRLLRLQSMDRNPTLPFVLLPFTAWRAAESSRTAQYFHLFECFYVPGLILYGMSMCIPWSPNLIKAYCTAQRVLFFYYFIFAVNSIQKKK